MYRGYEPVIDVRLADFITEMGIVELTGWSLEYIRALDLPERLAIEGYMRGKNRAMEVNRG